MSTPSHAARARHHLLTDAGLLPLRRQGTPLKRALREGDEPTRTRLARAWRETLDTLHGAGFGTEDAVAHALTDGHEVSYHPDAIWPLGTAHTRRPIAAWLDLDEASRWLTAQGRGAAEDDLAALFAALPPWPAFPAPPNPGLSLVLGAAPEIAALCAAHGIPCVGPAALGDLHRAEATTAQRLLRRALAGETPLVIAMGLSDASAPGSLSRLETFPAAIVRAQSLGRARLTSPDLAEALGVEPHLVRPPSPEAPRPSPGPRALEEARMAESPAARARAEALALEAAIDEHALPHDEAISRLTTLIDLAREGLDREAGQHALLRRGLAFWHADPRRALSDLSEARRLGGTRGTPALAEYGGIAQAFEAIIEALWGRSVPLRSSSLPLDVLAQRLAPTHQGPPPEDAALLALAFAGHPGPIRNAALALTVEHLGARAILAGREEDLERILRRLEQLALPPPCAPLISAWVSLLAARRGARMSCRDRLLALLPVLERRPDHLGQLAAERAALAAHSSGLDGLVAPLRVLSHTRAPFHLHTEGHELPLPPEGRALHLVLVAESLLEAPEGAIRRLLPRLLEAHGRHTGLQGLDLAMGRLLTRTDPHAARPLLLASAHGEPHLERLALESLATLPQLGTDEREAIRARLTQLRGRMSAPEAELPPPPLTPEAASQQVLHLLDVALAAASGPSGPSRWSNAVTALLGSPLGPLIAPSSAALGLQLITRDGAPWTLEAADGTETPLATTSDPPGRRAPELATRILATLAPVLEPSHVRPEPAARPSPAQLDRELTRRARDFFGDLVPAFKQHQLTLDELKATLHLGLLETRGLYRSLAARWHIDDYQRFMDFLRRNDAQLDYRPYRRGEPEWP